MALDEGRSRMSPIMLMCLALAYPYLVAIAPSALAAFNVRALAQEGCSVKSRDASAADSDPHAGRDDAGCDLIDNPASFGRQAVPQPGLSEQIPRGRRVRLDLPPEVRHVNMQVVHLLGV